MTKTQISNAARLARVKGITESSHHMTIKAHFKAHGIETNADHGVTVETLRQALREGVLTPVKRSRGKQPKAGRYDGIEKYAAKIAGVTEVGQNGKAKRVLILCQLPGCEEKREIATQDLFQVAHCCIAHKRAHQKLVAVGQAV